MGSKLRESALGLLARAYVCVGAQEIAVAYDHAGCHLSSIWKRLYEGPRGRGQTLAGPYRRHDPGVHAS